MHTSCGLTFSVSNFSRKKLEVRLKIRDSMIHNFSEVAVDHQSGSKACGIFKAYKGDVAKLKSIDPILQRHIKDLYHVA
ncbi:hypothetical protein TNCT_152571 [Trichonephila clavata]|uniref:Uncharacterized protein n=1 Tax=Trichonephila clavata TaxID=2740835 RepID=A0A8X6FQX9_TRICU|nr:hypothetical protein TNCT_152571 [Trichonephila clavata]